MSNDGIVKFRVIFEFDAVRARFDDTMYLSLRAWDEIRGSFVTITDDGLGTPCELTRPGERFVSVRIELRPE